MMIKAVLTKKDGNILGVIDCADDCFVIKWCGSIFAAIGHTVNGRRHYVETKLYVSWMPVEPP